MTSPRLSLAQEARLFDQPEGPVVVLGASAGQDLSGFDAAQITVVNGFRPDCDAWQARGIAVQQALPDAAALVVVFLPRSKVLARGLIAAAMTLGDGSVVIDGQKTDGIDSVLKDCRKRAEVSDVLSKAHGKLFVMRGKASDFADWALPDQPQDIGEGFVTLPGVFSADGIDPASRLLAQNLPAQLGKTVADLGAGWGYLSRAILTRAEVALVHLVEAEHAALTCARQNVPDPRAEFHWADATTWRPERAVDAVVMNPPFHTSRSAEPGLGQSFIASAAGCLAPHGRLWMVANRHLPYEATLSDLFAQCDEVAGDARFKVLCAQRPARHRRAERLR